MKKEGNIIVPRWFLEVVEDTLRIQNNINLDKDTGETCQDRNIRQSLNGVRKLLNSEELTGMERLEKLHPSLPFNLDKAAEETAKKYYCSCLEEHNETGICDGCENVKLSFKAGAEWMAEQGVSMQGKVGIYGVDVESITKELREVGFKIGEEVTLQIRKKQ